jgi:hypothetical protein
MPLPDATDAAARGAELVAQIVQATAWDRSWFPRPEVRAYRGCVWLRMRWTDSQHPIVQPPPPPEDAIVQHIASRAVDDSDFLPLAATDGTPPPSTLAEAAQQLRAFILSRGDHECREHLRAGEEWCFAPHGGPSVTGDERLGLLPSAFK